MITTADISTGESRLASSKLKDVDVSVLSSLLNEEFAGLVQKYGYEFESKLSAFDDSANNKKVAAQIAACLNKIEELGFDGSMLTGKGKSGMSYDSKIEFQKYLRFVFSKMYDIPSEMSTYDLSRRSRTVSGSIPTTVKY